MSTTSADYFPILSFSSCAIPSSLSLFSGSILTPRQGMSFSRFTLDVRTFLVSTRRILPGSTSRFYPLHLETDRRRPIFDLFSDDMNKTFVASYDHGSSSLLTSSAFAVPLSQPLVDGVASSSSSSRRLSSSRGGASSSGPSSRGRRRGSTAQQEVEEEESSGDDGEGEEGSVSGRSGEASSAGGPERSVTNRDVPVRRASLVGRGGRGG